jgi:hypothetical protein
LNTPINTMVEFHIRTNLEKFGSVTFTPTT